MSAHRIKIKARRKARQQAAATGNSPIRPSAIFGSPAVNLDNDDLDFPFPELDPACRAEQPYLPAVDIHALDEKVRRNPEIAGASRQWLDAKGLSHLYNTDFLKTAGPACSSTPIPSAAPASSAATAPAPAATAPAPATILPTPGQSTGPRSEEGKARSSHNAFKHGLSLPAGKSMTFLPCEETDAHTLLLLQFNQQFVPMTGAERELVREIVDSLWLARRARDLQTSALKTADHHALSLYLRYETAHQRAHNAAIKTLLTVQKDRRLRNQNHEQWDEPVLWGDLDFIVVPDSGPALSAYSAATTSPASTSSGTSFRSAAFKPWPEMTCGAENAHQAASGSTIEEVKSAA